MTIEEDKTLAVDMPSYKPIVTLDKFTQCAFFEIWSRRFHDNRVLLACHKVAPHNKIVFTKDPTLGTEPYYVSGKTIKKYPKESNGAIKCYVVPLDELKALIINQRSLHEC